MTEAERERQIRIEKALRSIDWAGAVFDEQMPRLTAAQLSSVMRPASQKEDIFDCVVRRETERKDAD